MGSLNQFGVEKTVKWSTGTITQKYLLRKKKHKLMTILRPLSGSIKKDLDS